MSRSLNESEASILIGQLVDVPKQRNTTVKVYVISNKSDFDLERCRLWRETVLHLQKYCVRHELDLVWADLQHGTQDDKVKEAATFQSILKDLKSANTGNAEPFFLFLIGNKYGDFPLPMQLSENEYEQLHLAADSKKNEGDILRERYVKDDNHVPPVFVLQPPSTAAQTGQTPGEDGYDQLSSILSKAALGKPQNHVQHSSFNRHTASGLEQAIRLAMECEAERCILLHRDIKGISTGSNDSAFIDTKKDGQIDEVKQNRLWHLLHNVKVRLPPANVFEFNLKYNASCSLPIDFEADVEYLENVSGAVGTRIVDMLDAMLRKTTHAQQLQLHPICKNALMHLSHCKKLCNSSVTVNQHIGDVLTDIADLLRQGATKEHYVIMISGPSNCGKSYLLANVCKKARQIFGKDTVLITRFVGLCPASTVSENTLKDVCTQLNYVLKQYIKITNYNMSKLKNYFHGLLNRITKGTRHVVVAIDGIDGLRSSEDEGQVYPLEWLVTKLPPKVHIIVTYTSPTPDYLLKLEHKVPTAKSKIAFPQFAGEETVVSFLGELRRRNRTVTSAQESFLRESFHHPICYSVIPLLLETVADWNSMFVPESFSLPDCFESAIASRLKMAEVSYGREVVKAICQYITLAKEGLTEMELLDLLSCNNSVVLSVFPSELPAILRFPYSLWIGIKDVLRIFLRVYTNHGKQLFNWCSTNTGNAVRKCYLQNIDDICRTQTDIADLFLETWVDSKPLVDPARNLNYQENGHRFVCPQPLLYNEHKYNMRRINLLWLQLLQLGKINELKEQAFCNFEYLLASIDSLTIDTFLSNLKTTVDNLLDPEIILVYNTFKLSADTLMEQPIQMANELIGRLRQVIEHYPNHLEILVTECMKWCDNYQYPLFVPLRSWLPKPYISEVTSIPETSSCRIIATVHSSQHLLCKYGPNDMVLYHTPTGKIIKTFTGHRGSLRCFYVSKATNTLVSGSDDGVVRVWDINGGVCTCVIREHKHAVNDVAMNSEWIISGSEDTTAILCTLKGRKHCTLRAHKKPVTTLKLNSSGSILATGSRDQTIVLWCLEGLTKLSTISDGIHSPITCMDLSCDNTFLVVGCDDGTLNVLSFTTGSWIHQLRGHEGTVNSVAVSRDCMHVIAGGKDTNVYLYNLRTTDLYETFQGHTNAVTCVAVANDDSFIFSASDKNVMVWNFYKRSQTPPEKVDHSGPVTCVATTFDGKLALSGGEDGILKLWNLEMSSFKENLTGHSAAITCISVSSDSTFCVTGSRDKTLFVWNVQIMVDIARYKNHEQMIQNVNILYGNKYVMSYDVQGVFHIWLPETGETFATYSIPAATYTLSVDSRYLVTARGDNSARIWVTQTGENIGCLTHNDRITCLAKSRDDMYLVTGSLDMSLKVWELRTGKLTQVLVEDTDAVTCVTVATSHVVSGSNNGMVIVWEISNGEPKHRMKGHKDTVTSLCLTTNALYFISASKDCTIRLWSLQYGTMLAMFDTHVPVCHVAMASEGRRLVVHMENNCSVPILCLHNAPGDNDDVIKLRPESADRKRVLPIIPRQILEHRHSVVYPVLKYSSKKRASSVSSIPQIIKLSPIKCPPKEHKKRSRFTLPSVKQKGVEDRRTSAVCHIL